MRFLLRAAFFGLAFLVLLSACSPSTTERSVPGGITPEAHSWLSILDGAPHALGKQTANGPIGCESCHPPTASSFKEFTCVTCHQHGQAVTDRLHTSVADYAFNSAACFGCHKAATPAFDHAGITGDCAACHDEGTPFAALPKPGFTHPERQGADCAGCHVTSSWAEAAAAPKDSFDPARSIDVVGLVPTWAGSTITGVTPSTQTLPMRMNHATSALPASVVLACEGCHADASAGQYYPGELHSSLANLGLPQPTQCADCHEVTEPLGFVGPLATIPPREPATGAMRHDAVLWVQNAPTPARAVPKDCGVCHASPSQALVANWTMNRAGDGAASFHPALAAAGLPQPASCIDCHANARPGGLLTSANAALPAGVEYDHSSGWALGDCAGCHTASAASAFTSWTGGQRHAAQSSTPSTCLPCHEARRPTSTVDWTSTTYARSPFDYVTNSAGVTHGAGQDCAVCHAGPGTGKWGGTQNWANGEFTHGPQTLSAQACINCHTTQRPDLQPGTTAGAMAALLGFDHALDGTGDCFGCHQATVSAGRYVDFVNPATGQLPGGDWKGGISYPGSTLVAAPNDFVTVQQINLVRSGANNLVTGTTTVSSTLYNAMLHTSAAIPAQLQPGPTGNPDTTTCWHCHTNSNGAVTSYAGGKFHSALTNFRAKPTSAVTPLPQPTSGCNDCHAQQRPSGIVERLGSSLEPMDHSSVGTMDCSSCHSTAGVKWADGKLHANVAAAAVPQDCTVCHYPTMADSAKADVTLASRYVMKHRSQQITFQKCDSCHASALANAAKTPIAASLWKTGVYHSSVTVQPTACNECHQVAVPAPNAPTQSSVVYTLALGATATNQGQWMNHGAPSAVGKDCAVCHAADAKSGTTTWSKATPLHAQVTKPANCAICHGTANGGGSTIGGKNNLPVGLTNSSMLTTASASAGTGVPAGTYAQITHSDVNVTSRDCGACHTQAGPSLGAGIQGKEWRQANFHAVFTAANPLLMNKTTGRCSNCHMNVKPGSSYPGPSHAAFTNVSGTQDCSSCHSWPGSGTATAPNWKGAAGGVPTLIYVGGFTIPKPPAAALNTTQSGISNLPHPSTTGTTCTSCHATASGGKNATGYDHASTLINGKCNACHEAGSNLVGTVWNGATTQNNGAGDTRPYTLNSVVAIYKGDSLTVTTANHFYPVDCYQCHVAPTGLATNTSGTTYRSRWSFPHTTSRMTNSSTCAMCHPNRN